MFVLHKTELTSPHTTQNASSANQIPVRNYDNKNEDHAGNKQEINNKIIIE
jgi:hypothetical protein